MKLLQQWWSRLRLVSMDSECNTWRHQVQWNNSPHTSKLICDYCRDGTDWDHIKWWECIMCINLLYCSHTKSKTAVKLPFKFKRSLSTTFTAKVSGDTAGLQFSVSQNVKKEKGLHLHSSARRFCAPHPESGCGGSRLRKMVHTSLPLPSFSPTMLSFLSSSWGILRHSQTSWDIESLQPILGLPQGVQ